MMMMEEKSVTEQRVHLWVEGRVQGVCFRHYTRQEACRLGCTGWVRNLYDGRVEAVIEGNAAAVAELVSWCHHGPQMAQVTKVDVQSEEPTSEFDDFRVTG